MRIRIRIEKNVALLAGKDVYGQVIVNVPASELTELQRKTLIGHSHLPTDEKLCDYGLDYLPVEISRSIKDVNEGSIESVKKILDRLIEVDKEDRLKEDRLIKEEEEKEAKEVADFLASQKENPELAIEDEYEVFKPVYILRQSIKNPELEKVANWAEAECERRNIERKTKNQEELAASLKADRLLRETGEKTLLTWSAEFGSSLLKSRISDGYEWVGLAEQEFSEKVIDCFNEPLRVPNYVSSKESKRTTPNLEEIEMIRHFRKELEGRPAIADLIWTEYVLTNNTKLKQSEIKVTVTCPTGREIEHYYQGED